MFAILLSALAPAVSHAMARAAGAQGADWGVICTAFGMVPLAIDADTGADGDASKAPSSLDPMQACAYCSVHAGSDGLIPSEAPQTQRVRADFVLSSADVVAPPRRPDYGFAESRAPPVVA